MEFKIVSKGILHIAEWDNQMIINDLDKAIIVDLNHTELKTNVLVIKKATKTKKGKR